MISRALLRLPSSSLIESEGQEAEKDQWQNILLVVRRLDGAAEFHRGLEKLPEEVGMVVVRLAQAQQGTPGEERQRDLRRCKGTSQ